MSFHITAVGKRAEVKASLAAKITAEQGNSYNSAPVKQALGDIGQGLQTLLAVLPDDKTVTVLVQGHIDTTGHSSVKVDVQTWL